MDVGSGTVLETRELEGGQQPMLTPDDCLLAESVVKDDPRFKSLLAERYGIPDTEKVACDVSSLHYLPTTPTGLTTPPLASLPFAALERPLHWF